MKHIVTLDRLDEYKTINPLLESIYTEIRTFALKKQDSALSKLKVLAINKVLERAKKLVDGEPFAEFTDLLDIDTLPTYSDAVMIIANHKTAMAGFVSKYQTHVGYGSYKWNLPESDLDEEYEDENDD